MLIGLICLINACASNGRNVRNTLDQELVKELGKFQNCNPKVITRLYALSTSPHLDAYLSNFRHFQCEAFVSYMQRQSLVGTDRQRLAAYNIAAPQKIFESIFFQFVESFENLHAPNARELQRDLESQANQTVQSMANLFSENFKSCLEHQTNCTELKLGYVSVISEFDVAQKRKNVLNQLLKAQKVSKDSLRAINVLYDSLYDVLYRLHELVREAANQDQKFFGKLI